MDDEMKDNICTIVFNCDLKDKQSCVYLRPDSQGYRKCFDYRTRECSSSVARVNAMVKEMKKLGFVPLEEVYKSVFTEIQALLKRSLDTNTGLKPVEEASALIEGFLKEIE